MQWLAMALGLAGGLLLCYWVGRATLPRLVASSRNPELAVKLTFAGTAVAALPALLLAIVVGAPLGMPLGAAGLAGGVAAVFALVLLGGTFGGALLARLFTRPGA